MCVICDGAAYEELHTDEFVRIAMHGFTMVGVESSPPWTYTIGLSESWSHPELVITDLRFPSTADLITAVVDRIREGQRFDASSPPLLLCECTSVAFGAVHPAQWDQGRFNGWVRYYDWLGGEAPEAKAIQLLWPDRDGRFPPDPDFCPVHRGGCQPLLDGAPRHDVNSGGSREQRRPANYGHGKRSRRRSGSGDRSQSERNTDADDDH